MAFPLDTGSCGVPGMEVGLEAQYGKLSKDLLLLYQSCSLVFSTAIPKHRQVTSKALSEYGRENHFDKKIQLKPSNNHFRNHKN